VRPLVPMRVEALAGGRPRGGVLERVEGLADALDG
jgi:hypothetical protein